MDYTNLETSKLLREAKTIAEVLMERLSLEEFEDEDRDTIENLIHLFNLDGKRRYTLKIGAEGPNFYTEWNTPESSTYKMYGNLDKEHGIPDERLLERAPVKWLENLLLGVYSVQEL